METQAPSAEAIREQLNRILQSAAFRSARRSTDILRFIVEQTLAGQGGRLKEYTIGAEALGRGTMFDPRSDPIARVEASRLRTRLDLYNATDGAKDPVVISLPKGGYTPSFASKGSRAPTRAGRTFSPRLALALASLAGAGAALLAVLLGQALLATAPQPAPNAIQADIALGAPVELADQVGNSLALSPDGKAIAFVGVGPDHSTQLYVRRLESPSAVPLADTRGASIPFFSPDSRWVGFSADGKLKKILASGEGRPITLADQVDPLGASWSNAGFILATRDRSSSLWRIPDETGSPVEIPDPQANRAIPRWPDVLPGGAYALVTVNDEPNSDPGIAIVDLATGIRTPLIQRGAYARYRRGQIVYIDNGTLYAAAFDVARLQLSGEPVAIVHDVAADFAFGYAQFDAADNGALVWQRDPTGGLFTISRILPGGAVAIVAEAGRYGSPRLSPDGKRLAFSQLAGGDNDIWVIDLTTGIRSRVAGGDGHQVQPAWSADGKWLFFSDGSGGIRVQRSDGSGSPQDLINNQSAVSSVSPDGRHIAFFGAGNASDQDIWIAPFSIEGETVTVGNLAPLFASPAFDINPRFSPDGKWVAYASNPSGRFEVFVRPFPGPGPETAISAAGGRMPMWGRDKTLLFIAGDNRIMSARYEVRNGRLSAQPPVVWSEVRVPRTGVLVSYDTDPTRSGVVALTDDSLAPGWRADHIAIATGLLDANQRD